MRRQRVISLKIVAETLDKNIEIVLLIFEIDIFYSLEAKRFFTLLKFRQILVVSFIITFD